jgi:uncharacterized protein
MEELLLSLDDRHLVIQGLPGSGKTWTSGRLIARLLAEGKRVGVASTGHKAIHRLLEEVEAAGIAVAGVKKSTAGNPESIYEGSRITSDEDRQACLSAPLSGGTAWLYSHGDFDGSLDYLFIDEAGQVALADALALATAARNVVLVGDPQQLAQVLQGTHPEGVQRSVLQYLLGEHATIPPDRGLFLETTYRLHPNIGDYISDEFYEGRLQLRPILRHSHDRARYRTSILPSRAPRLPAGVARGGRPCCGRGPVFDWVGCVGGGDRRGCPV